MSNPQPAARNQEPQHDPEEATRWFNQWHVYRAIVDANWMAHREIFSAVRSGALLRYPGPFTLSTLSGHPKIGVHLRQQGSLGPRCHTFSQLGGLYSLKKTGVAPWHFGGFWHTHF